MRRRPYYRAARLPDWPLYARRRGNDGWLIPSYVRVS